MFRLSLSALFLVASFASAEPLAMTARYRVANAAEASGFEVREKIIKWEPKQTAIIICDMWDNHWCQSAAKRCAEIAPRMNTVVEEARKRGVFVIHAPSDCMNFYKDTPQRKLAQSAPMAKNQPKDIAAGCRQLPNEPTLAVDASDGGCDDAMPDKEHRAWNRQHEAIKIHGEDAISDSGKEIWNLLEAREITNVLLMGVHTNMCVVGRPFGLRQMAKNGKNVVLVRDLTDAMYNPAKPPFVAHRRGTEMIIAHIEAHICPSITAQDIYTHPAPMNVAFVIGEDEYKTEISLPKFAKEELEKRNVRCTFIYADAKDKNSFPDIAKIKDADLVVISVRRRTPPPEQLTVLYEYALAGRPIVGIRTASHAFALRDKPDGWPEFDKDVLGGNYNMHYPNEPMKGPPTVVSQVDTSAKHPILTGVAGEFQSKGSLYKNTSLAKTATPLLWGKVGPNGSEKEFVAWTNTYKGGRVFYTSLGYIEDFDNPSFRRLLLNGIFWAMERAIPGDPRP
jgi:nicotinamidase-related amidase/type 1 glutamine amidotransferase